MVGMWGISSFSLLRTMPPRTLCSTCAAHVHTLWNISRSGTAGSQWGNGKVFSPWLHPFPFSEGGTWEFSSNVLCFISSFPITNGVACFLICLLTTGYLLIVWRACWKLLLFSSGFSYWFVVLCQLYMLQLSPPTLVCPCVLFTWLPRIPLWLSSLGNTPKFGCVAQASLLRTSVQLLICYLHLDVQKSWLNFWPPHSKSALLYTCCLSHLT